MLRLDCLSGGVTYFAQLDQGRMTSGGGAWSLLKSARGAASLGAHFWRTDHGPDVIECAVMVSKAEWPHSGCINYEQLSLTVPAEWSILTETRKGERISWLPFTPKAWTIVARGKHWLPSRFAFVRRFVLYRGRGKQTAQKLLDGYPYSPPDTVGVSRTPSIIAAFNQRTDAWSEVLRIRAARKNGTALAYWGDGTNKYDELPCGPLWGLYNVRDSAEQGGQQIYITPGCLASREHALMHRMQLDHTIERSPLAMFHNVTGEILMRDDVGAGNEYRMQRGFNKIQQVADYVSITGEEWDYRVHPQDGVPYAFRLDRWTPPDDAHFVRAWAPAIGAWYQLKDPVARWWLQMCAGDVVMSHSLVKIPKTSSWETFSLARDIELATAFPHTGGRLVRAESWVARVVAEAAGAMQ